MMFTECDKTAVINHLPAALRVRFDAIIEAYDESRRDYYVDRMFDDLELAQRYGGASMASVVKLAFMTLCVVCPDAADTIAHRRPYLEQYRIRD